MGSSKRDFFCRIGCCWAGGHKTIFYIRVSTVEKTEFCFFTIRHHSHYSTSYLSIVYDRNHYFGFGPIPKPKPKLADTFGRYRNRYRNHISKGKSSYQ